MKFHEVRHGTIVNLESVEAVNMDMDRMTIYIHLRADHTGHPLSVVVPFQNEDAMDIAYNRLRFALTTIPHPEVDPS